MVVLIFVGAAILWVKDAIFVLLVWDFKKCAIRKQEFIQKHLQSTYSETYMVEELELKEVQYPQYYLILKSASNYF